MTSPESGGNDPEEREGEGESGGDGLSAGLLMALIVAALFGIGMVAFVFPGILVLVPVALVLAAILALQVGIYRLFGLKVSGPEKQDRKPRDDLR